MKKVTELKNTLISESSEISVNQGEYIGYVIGVSDTEIVIENYDMEHETIKISNIYSLRNMDEDIYFSRAA